MRRPPWTATPTTVWRSPTGNTPSLTLDLGFRREFGGLVIDWDSLDYARAYEIRGSNDQRDWRVLRRVARGNGGRDWLYLPESEAQWVRIAVLTASRGRGIGVREVQVKPLEWSATPNAFFADIARETPPGSFPRYWPDRQTFWTLVGVEGDFREAMLSEDGALESDKGSFTIEPFLRDGTRPDHLERRRDHAIARGRRPSHPDRSVALGEADAGGHVLRDRAPRRVHGAGALPRSQPHGHRRRARPCISPCARSR